MTDQKSYEAKIEDLAGDLGIKLYGRFTSREAADILGLSTPTLNRIRARGDIAYLKLGDRQVRFFGFQLLSYMLQSIEEAKCQNTPRNEISKLASTGFPNNREAQPGAEPSMTEIPDKQNALHYAQKTFRKLKND